MDRASSTAVLREALAGSDAALDTLYERYGPRLLSFIRLKMGRSLRARLESRDILQATFLKSFQHLDDFEGQDGRALLGWLMRIAEHEIRDRADFHHRQQRDAAREEDLGDRHDLAARSRSALTRLILDEQAERLDAALESLTDAHRAGDPASDVRRAVVSRDRPASSASRRTRAACSTRAP